MSAEFDNISFEMPKSQSNAIKVIGVGGGGSNAVNHMYTKQIHGVDFVICNTDAQALESSAIPNKIQLGAHLTSGLGAGANPEIGAQAAAESIQEVQQMLSTNTKMVFITAGMGGGTGTGAAPIIAKIAKDMDILVVGIVTMPFQFEGKMRSKQAQKGIDELRRNVDSLIVINNNKLREVYGNLGFKAGFSKADEVLSTAAKGIAEVITHHYKQNIDLHDAKTVLSNSGTAIMGSAKESGENRAKNAIMKALDSPLLNDNKITGAKNVLLLIVSGSNEVTLDEIGEINDYIQEEAGYDANIIMGVGEDESLEDEIAVTVVATGFTYDQQHTITNTEIKKVVHTLEENQRATYNFSEDSLSKVSAFDKPLPKKEDISTDSKNNNNDQRPNNQVIYSSETVENIDVVYDDIRITSVDAIIEGRIVTEDKDPDLIINEVSQKDDKVLKEPTESVQQNLLFELPIEGKNTEKEETISKKSSIEVSSLGDVQKRYVLEDFDVEPTIGKSSRPVVKKEEEDSQLQFKRKVKTSVEVNTQDDIQTNEEASPLSLTISELQKRTEERRNKLKQFNYKFSDSVNNNIDEIEREPAYKRKGVDIKFNTELSKKEISLKNKQNDLGLSGNSFLHDNVD